MKDSLIRFNPLPHYSLVGKNAFLHLKVRLIRTPALLIESLQFQLFMRRHDIYLASYALLEETE